jgi:hypothetical protein
MKKNRVKFPEVEFASASWKSGLPGIVHSDGYRLSSAAHMIFGMLGFDVLP